MAARTVWKVRLSESETLVRLPLGAQVVHVDMQDVGHAWPMVWVEVDPDQPEVDVMYQVVGTGHPIAAGAQHVGSTLVENGLLVWHVYEVPLG